LVIADSFISFPFYPFLCLCKKTGTLSSRAMQELVQYDWYAQLQDQTSGHPKEARQQTFLNTDRFCQALVIAK
jgi:hypothetical protein